MASIDSDAMMDAVFNEFLVGGRTDLNNSELTESRGKKTRGIFYVQDGFLKWSNHEINLASKSHSCKDRYVVFLNFAFLVSNHSGNSKCPQFFDVGKNGEEFHILENPIFGKRNLDDQRNLGGLIVQRFGRKPWYFVKGEGKSSMSKGQEFLESILNNMDCHKSKLINLISAKSAKSLQSFDQSSFFLYSHNNPDRFVDYTYEYAILCLKFYTKLVAILTEFDDFNILGGYWMTLVVKIFEWQEGKKKNNQMAPPCLPTMPEYLDELCHQFQISSSTYNSINWDMYSHLEYFQIDLIKVTRGKSKTNIKGDVRYKLAYKLSNGKVLFQLDKDFNGPVVNNSGAYGSNLNNSIAVMNLDNNMTESLSGTTTTSVAFSQEGTISIASPLSTGSYEMNGAEHDGCDVTGSDLMYLMDAIEELPEVAGNGMDEDVLLKWGERDYSVSFATGSGNWKETQSVLRKRTEEFQLHSAYTSFGQQPWILSQSVVAAETTHTVEPQFKRTRTSSIGSACDFACLDAFLDSDDWRNLPVTDINNLNSSNSEVSSEFETSDTTSHMGSDATTSVESGSDGLGDRRLFSPSESELRPFSTRSSSSSLSEPVTYETMKSNIYCMLNTVRGLNGNISTVEKTELLSMTVSLYNILAQLSPNESDSSVNMSDQMDGDDGFGQQSQQQQHNSSSDSTNGPSGETGDGNDQDSSGSSSSEGFYGSSGQYGWQDSCDVNVDVVIGSATVEMAECFGGECDDTECFESGESVEEVGFLEEGAHVTKEQTRNQVSTKPKESTNRTSTATTNSLRRRVHTGVLSMQQQCMETDVIGDCSRSLRYTCCGSCQESPGCSSGQVWEQQEVNASVLTGRQNNYCNNPTNLNTDDHENTTQVTNQTRKDIERDSGDFFYSLSELSSSIRNISSKSSSSCSSSSQRVHPNVNHQYSSQRRRRIDHRRSPNFKRTFMCSSSEEPKENTGRQKHTECTGRSSRLAGVAESRSGFQQKAEIQVISSRRRIRPDHTIKHGEENSYHNSSQEAAIDEAASLHQHNSYRYSYRHPDQQQEQEEPLVHNASDCHMAVRLRRWLRSERSDGGLLSVPDTSITTPSEAHGHTMLANKTTSLRGKRTSSGDGTLPSKNGSISHIGELQHQTRETPTAIQQNPPQPPPQEPCLPQGAFTRQTVSQSMDYDERTSFRNQYNIDSYFPVSLPEPAVGVRAVEGSSVTEVERSLTNHVTTTISNTPAGAVEMAVPMQKDFLLVDGEATGVPSLVESENGATDAECHQSRAASAHQMLKGSPTELIRSKYQKHVLYPSLCSEIVVKANIFTSSSSTESTTDVETVSTSLLRPLLLQPLRPLQPSVETNFNTTEYLCGVSSAPEHSVLKHYCHHSSDDSKPNSSNCRNDEDSESASTAVGRQKLSVYFPQGLLRATLILFSLMCSYLLIRNVCSFKLNVELNPKNAQNTETLHKEISLTDMSVCPRLGELASQGLSTQHLGHNQDLTVSSKLQTVSSGTTRSFERQFALLIQTSRATQPNHSLHRERGRGHHVHPFLFNGGCLSSFQPSESNELLFSRPSKYQVASGLDDFLRDIFYGSVEGDIGDSTVSNSTHSELPRAQLIGQILNNRQLQRLVRLQVVEFSSNETRAFIFHKLSWMWFSAVEADNLNASSQVTDQMDLPYADIPASVLKPLTGSRVVFLQKHLSSAKYSYYSRSESEGSRGVYSVICKSLQPFEFRFKGNTSNQKDCSVSIYDLNHVLREILGVNDSTTLCEHSMR